MTTRNMKIIESDLSGAVDAGTVTFGIGDVWYEVDLTKEEEATLRASLEQYVKVGRKAQAKSVVKPNRSVPKLTPAEREKIRTWAQENGYDIEMRGRIPKAVIEAWAAEHKQQLEWVPEG